MNIQQILTDTLRGIQEEMGISVLLTETRRGHLFPEINLRTGEVTFNTKLRALVTLYNYMLIHPDMGCETVSLYTLYNMYTETCRYDDAGEALTLLTKELSRFPTSTNKEEGNLTAQSVDLQVLFILLHECAHLLFHSNSGLRARILGNVRQRMEDMRIDPAGIPERMRAYTESFVPGGLPEELRREMMQEMNEKMKQFAGDIFDFSKYLNSNDDSTLEEFGCDQVACGLALARFINLNPKGDAVLEAAIEMFMALYILDYDRCFRSIYAGLCEECMVEMPRIAGARHANLRGFIYELFLEHGNQEIASEFLRQAEARDEGGKRLMLPSVFDHLADMMTLQHGEEGKPLRSRALELEKRFAEVEKKILALLDT